MITPEDIEHYFLIQQAKYLGVAPWELLKAHPVWRLWAAQCIEVENVPPEQKEQWKWDSE